jgi:hypothetical protein
MFYDEQLKFLEENMVVFISASAGRKRLTSGLYCDVQID